MPSATCVIPPLRLLFRGVLETPKEYSLPLFLVAHEDLMVRLSQTLVPAYAEIKLVLTIKFPLGWLSFMVLEGAREAACEWRGQSTVFQLVTLAAIVMVSVARYAREYPTDNPTNHDNDQRGKICPSVQQ